MKEIIIYWLRWLAVLPGAMVSAILITFPFRWLLLLLFARGDSDDLSLISVARDFGGTVESVEYLLYPAIMAFVFVYTGSRIAPEHNFNTAKVLFGLNLITWIVILIFVFTNDNFLGITGSFSIRTVLVPIGALLGLFSSKKNKEDSNV